MQEKTERSAAERGGPVRSPQSLVGGAALLALAVLALYLTQSLAQGTLRAMGPAMLPRFLAVGVGLAGLALVAAAFVKAGDPLEGWSLRGPAFVVLAILAFAATIRPLALGPIALPGLGLLVAGPLAIFISGYATGEARARDLVILSLALTAVCMELFGDMLNLPIPLFPQAWRGSSPRTGRRRRSCARRPSCSPGRPCSSSSPAGPARKRAPPATRPGASDGRFRLQSRARLRRRSQAHESRPRLSRLPRRHADRRAARRRPDRHDRDAAADHLRARSGRRADHARRHLLRRAVRRLDDRDPRQHPGRGDLGRHHPRRPPDGAPGPRRRRARHRRHRLLLRRHRRDPRHRRPRRAADPARAASSARRSISR